MTAEQTYQVEHLNLDGRLFLVGVTVNLVEGSGAPVFTVRSWTEPGPVTVVAADGDIDVDTAPLLRYVLDQAFDGQSAVCCELSKVTFFGAAAVNALLAAHQRATGRGHRLVVRGARAMTGRVLAIADPDRVIARY